MKTISLIPSLAAAALLLIVQSAPSAAVTIQFNDLTETPSAVAGDQPPFEAVKTCISESSCFVALPDFLKADSGPYQAQFALTEPAGGDDPAGTLSDVIQFSVSGNTPRELDVFLFSDPISSQIASLTFYGTATEIGALQPITLPGNLPALDTGRSLTVEVASDAVPLPAALPLFASGLGLMGWFARRKKRKVAEAIAA
jgi:hypothetical protein